MRISDDKKLEILHDHFKESFFNIREREKIRDSLFLVLIVAFILLVFEIQYPINLGSAINRIHFFGSEIDLTKIPLAPLLNASWIFCLTIALRYSQVTKIIDRQYAYLHKLEEKISKKFGNPEIYTREGKSYLQNYPIYQNWVWFCYVVIFPIIVVGATIALLYLEWNFFEYSSLPHKIFDLIIGLSIVVTFALYRTIPQVIVRFRKPS